MAPMMSENVLKFISPRETVIEIPIILLVVREERGVDDHSDTTQLLSQLEIRRAKGTHLHTADKFSFLLPLK